MYKRSGIMQRSPLPHTKHSDVASRPGTPLANPAPVMVVWCMIELALASLPDPQQRAFVPPHVFFPPFAVILFLAGWFNRGNRQQVWNGITMSGLVVMMYFMSLQ